MAKQMASADTKTSAKKSMGKASWTTDDVYRLLKAVNEDTLGRIERLLKAVNEQTLARMEKQVKDVNEITLKRMEEQDARILHNVLSEYDLLKAVNEQTLRRMEDAILAIKRKVEA